MFLKAILVNSYDIQMVIINESMISNRQITAFEFTFHCVYEHCEEKITKTWQIDKFQPISFQFC